MTKDRIVKIQAIRKYYKRPLTFVGSLTDDEIEPLYQNIPKDFLEQIKQNTKRLKEKRLRKFFKLSYEEQQELYK